MADVNLKIGLDASQLFANLQKAFTEVQKIAGLKFNIDAGAAASEVGQLGNQATKAKTELDKVAAENFSQAKQGADSLANSLGDVGKNAGGAGGAMAQVQSGLQGAFGGSFVGGIIGGGLSGVVSSAVGAITNAASAAFDEYKALDKNIANIATLGVESAGLSLNKFEGLINDLSKKAPDSASNIANGVYNAISAGITGTEEEIVKFVETASRVGVAGVADTNAAVNGLTSVVNAYGLGSAGAEQTSNIFFATIKAGKTTFNELNAGLANVIPAASAAGIQFDEVGAAIAKLTTVGIPTAQATTQLRSAIIELQKPGKPLADVLAKVGLNASNMGEQLKKPASEGGGLINTLQMVEKAAKESGLSMTQVFSSSEAASASLSLTGKNAASALTIFDGVQKDIAEGVADKAYEAASKSIDVQFSILKNQVQGLFNDAFAGLKNIVNEVLPIFMSGFERLKAVFNDVFGNAGAPAIDFMEILRGIASFMTEYLVTSFTNLMNVGKVVFDVLVYAFNATKQAIQPLLDSLGNGSGGIQGVFNAVSVVVKFLADLLGGALKIGIDIVSFTLGILAKAASLIVEGIKIVINIFNMAKDAIISVVNEVQKFIEIFDFATESVNGGQGVFEGFGKILDDVYNAIKEVADAIFNFGSEVITKYFIEPIKTAINWVGQIITKIIDWVKTLPGVEKAIQIIQDVIAATGSFFNNIDKLITGVKTNIAGVIFAVGEVGKIAKAIWDDLLSLNFQGVIDKIGNAPAQIAKAFKEGKTSAEAFLASQNQVQKQAEKPVVKKVQIQTTTTEIKKVVDEDTNTKDTKDKDTKNNKDKETAKTKDAKTAFQERKSLYDLEAKNLENVRNADLVNFKGSEDAKADFLADRLAGDSLKLNAFLNKQFQDATGTEFINAPVKIKPVAGKETDTDIQKFYTDIFLKNKSAIDKAANSQLKDQLKTEAVLRKQQVADAEKQYKELSEIIAADIKQNTGAIATAIPNIGAITQAQYDDATKNAEGYIETLRIKNKFIEDQLVSAQIAGADKAAESLQKQLDANNSLFNTAQQRLDAYTDASEISLQNSTLANVAALAIQKGLFDVFLNDKTQAERDQAEQARQDKLNALKDEESDLQSSFANREISFDEYQQKVATMAEQRREAEAVGEQGLNNIMANLKRAGETAVGEIAKQESAKMILTATTKQDEIIKAETDLAAAQRRLNKTKKTDLEAYAKAEADVTENTKKLADTDEQTYGFRTSVLEEFTGRAIEQFGVLASSGTATIADAGRAALGLVVDLLKKQIPIWAASIFGTTVGQLGPLGILVAGGLTATLYALAAEATSGFKKGGYTGDAETDQVAGVVHGQEYVLNADATRQNRDVLEWANKTNRPISEYFRSHSLEHKTYAVSDSGEIVLEVQKLREETRNLGVQIRRNTVVEISGNLVGDGRSINAIIENNKRKSIKRG